MENKAGPAKPGRERVLRRGEKDEARPATMTSRAMRGRKGSKEVGYVDQEPGVLSFACRSKSRKTLERLERW